MDAKVELLIWTGILLLFGIVVVNAAHRAQGGQLVRYTEETAQGAILREVGLFILMVGIPFIALISGASGLDLMALGADLASPDQIIGFTFVNWVRGTGMLVAVVLCVLIVLWLGGRSTPRGEPWHIGLLAIRDAIYQEVHWTFYRTAPILWLGEPYWGVVIGALLVLLEWVAHPDSTTLLATIEGRQYVTIRLACLFSSGFLYLTTQNLWLMVIANLAIQWAGSRLLAARQPGDGAHQVKMND